MGFKSFYIWFMFSNDVFKEIVPKENDEKSGKSAERKVLIRLSPTGHLVSAVKKRFPSKFFIAYNIERWND
ncbi:hypothetical protein TNCT_199111 [Trichonephila clavata]|uniref:Uncharacterized protein n=1 Tax=Trichonephila clavata TaxID=2740835 RepID=A0A8X6GQ42_TRICU|nr:hypothetical protein TNCT_199111 [Trichonephila clavata]